MFISNLNPGMIIHDQALGYNDRIMLIIGVNDSKFKFGTVVTYKDVVLLINDRVERYTLKSHMLLSYYSFKVLSSATG